MGCTSSKRIRANETDIFKPSPAGFLVFDVDTIEEPWKTETMLQQEQEKLASPEEPTSFPSPILRKISKFESVVDAPRPWSEVSQDLENDFKLKQHLPIVSSTKKIPELANPRKNLSFHTADELDTDKFSKRDKAEEATMVRLRRTATEVEPRPAKLNLENQNGVVKSLKENPFIIRDRLEREKEGTKAAYDRMMNYKRDPLSGYPERCPPAGENSLVVYTTSLRGVRKTYDDCVRVLSILENHRVVFDERDVSLHGEFLSELRLLIGDAEGGAGVPRVFLKGRDLGNVNDVVELNESGRLGRMIGWARVDRKLDWRPCDGCGGSRFVPCLDCHGSCKVVRNSTGEKERCGSCNENGLVRCPACQS